MNGYGNLFRKVVFLQLISMLVSFNPAWSMPYGGSFPTGGVSGSVSGSTMTINQSINRAIVNWQSFGIHQGETVQFNQPSATSAILNRVTGGSQSVINGSLTANGQVLLLNPSGVLIGSTGYVSVGSLLVSTGSLSDYDFLKGNISNITNLTSTAPVQVQGSAAIYTNGDLALVSGPGGVSIQGSSSTAYVSMESSGNILNKAVGGSVNISYGALYAEFTQGSNGRNITNTASGGSVNISNSTLQAIGSVTSGDLSNAGNITNSASGGSVNITNSSLYAAGYAYPNANSAGGITNVANITNSASGGSVTISNSSLNADGYQTGSIDNSANIRNSASSGNVSISNSSLNAYTSMPSQAQGFGPGGANITNSASSGNVSISNSSLIASRYGNIVSNTPIGNIYNNATGTITITNYSALEAYGGSVFNNANGSITIDSTSYLYGPSGVFNSPFCNCVP